MTAQAVDSFGIHTKASAAALAQAGIVAAMRYHYNTSRLEVDTLHAAGVGFGLIAEFDTATWHPPLHAPQTGGQHGVTAVKVAQALGMPQGCAISFTQDCYIPPQNRDAAVTYFSGAAIPVRAAGYRIMGYGDAFLMELCLQRGAIDLIWQAGADSWSQGSVAPHASLWQRVGAPVYAGVTCDPNTILKADCGFWMPNGAQTPTPPITPSIPTPPRRLGMFEIVKFPDKDNLWGHGYDRDGEFFWPIPSPGDIDPTLNLPTRLLSSGNDDLDARFHRITGI